MIFTGAWCRGLEVLGRLSRHCSIFIILLFVKLCVKFRLVFKSDQVKNFKHRCEPRGFNMR